MRLMIACPNTGKTVPSGFGFSGTVAQFDSSTYANNYTRCAACGEMHLVDNATIKVFPEEPSPPSNDPGVR